MRPSEGIGGAEMARTLQGKVSIVTGASRGLGKGVALAWISMSPKRANIFA